MNGDAAGGRHRAIRSYVVRAGRMTSGQQRALDELWPRYGIDAGDTPLELPQLFGRGAPVTLEIGFGNGDNLAALAAAHPERNFLGVEVHPPGVGHLLGKAAAANLTNLRVIQQDAVEVLELRLLPGSLDSLLVLFPDPWHKKRHHKRRLISAQFATLAVSRLAPGGTLQLATDWTPYAQWMLEVLNVTPGLANVAADGRYVPRNPGRVRTRFEARGERLGHAVHDLCYERIREPDCHPAQA
ncbi:MAG: tRNA (guanosine(46)-N7)-methyltransferase TrmB [Steroidobacteraceae bacterium]